MDRRSLLFVILLNSLISLVIAIVVVWAAEVRRPDLEELAARYTPPPPVVLIATPTGDAAVPVVIATAAPAPAQSNPSPTAPAASSDSEIYVVQVGDSLFGIALRYNLTVEQLMEANNLDDPDFVFSGQRLVIPKPGQTAGSTPVSAGATPSAVAGGLTVQVEQAGNLPEESVLIVNDSNNALNLQGWTLGKVNGAVYAFNDLPLFPGGSVRLHSETGQDDSLNLYWSQSAPVWESGAVVRLFNADGREVVTYTVP
ncbi:MAG: LysM peptidoglycan-binding domain-containing protein [Caldilineaceae bacterium]